MAGIHYFDDSGAHHNQADSTRWHDASQDQPHSGSCGRITRWLITQNHETVRAHEFHRRRAPWGVPDWGLAAPAPSSVRAGEQVP